MSDLNVVALIGNLTAEPELRNTATGTPVASLRLGVTSRGKNAAGEWENQSNYFQLTVWGRQAEAAAEHLTKGSRVAVSGRLVWRKWDAVDGSPRSTVEVVAEDLQYLSAPVTHPDEAKAGDDIPF